MDPLQALNPTRDSTKKVVFDDDDISFVVISPTGALHDLLLLAGIRPRYGQRSKASIASYSASPSRS